jgi:hypothetical protein
MVMLAHPLHPAARRRMVAAMSEPAMHAVILRPLGSRLMDIGRAGGFADVIHTSKSDKWTQSLLADLEAPDWQAKIRAMRNERRANGTAGLLELHLPTHKRFQIALFEVVCKRPGTPRLDAKMITGSGMVLRRQNADVANAFESWLTLDGRRLGWKPADERIDYDPDANQRRNCHKANAAIRNAIAARRPHGNNASEQIFPLHVAPPRICEARGKTILFGMIPVASNETEDRLPPALNYATLQGADRTDMIKHLSGYLKQRPALGLPRPGQRLRPDWDVLTISIVPSPDQNDPSPITVETERLRALGVFLHQLSSELNIFGKGPKALALRNLLQQIRLPTQVSANGQILDTTDALSFVTGAKAVLLEGDDKRVVHMPLEWPAVDAQFGNRLTTAALDCLSEQFAAQRIPVAKFARKNARYAIKAFVRVRGHGDCPDHLTWTGYSEPFRILEWWEGDGPNTKISLPAMNQLRKVKPNVTFDVPPSISAILQGDMKKLGKGEDPGSGMEIGWLCSFSIPIITLCAFIVLHIFLALLDFIFRWMLWIKICIPIPKSKQGE